MAGVLDIIQRIAIEGDKAVTASLNRVGDAGASAFEKIGAAAAKVAAPLQGFERDAGNVSARALEFGKSIRLAATGLGSFVTRVSAVGAGVAAVGTRLISSTLGISTALRTIRESQLEARLAASQNAAETKRQIQTDFSHANALEDLALQFRQGKITSQDYNEQLRELTRTQERAQKQAVQLSIEQEDIRKQQAADQAAVQRRAVAIKLEASFGSQLASVLVNLSNVLEQVRQRFLATFGPQMAQFLTNVVTAISNATPQIFAAFERVSQSIQKTFAASKVTIADVIKTMIAFGEQAANVFITVVIPAFQAVIEVLNVIAATINSVFGTNLSASSIIAGVIILRLVGLFKLLQGGILLIVTGIRLIGASFGPVGIIITALVALIVTQLIPLLAKIDWSNIGAQAVEVWNTVVKAFATAITFIQTGWGQLVSFFDTSIQQVIGFFQDLINKVKEFLGLTSGASGSSLAKDAGIGDIGGFNRGGLFRGRPGRDTNLAWLTDKEYVMNPKATKHWGVGFMNAINNMRMPNLRGYSMGGLVGAMSPPVPVPRFAGGGLNRTAGRPFVLQMKDGTEFKNMTVQDDTAAAMGMYAARQGLRSGSRKPLWFGGSKR